MLLRAKKIFAAGAILFGLSAVLVLAGGNQQLTYAQEIPSGSGIVCDIYEYLVSQGLPIPPGLDASSCEDGGGGGEPNVPGDTECSNFIDDDGDGLIDFLPGLDAGDPDCSSLSDDSESTPAPVAACADGVDNDGDQLIDLADAGCSDAADTDETNAVVPPEDEEEGDGDNGGGNGNGDGGGGGSIPMCSDDLDNDGDGLVDGDDPGCENDSDINEANTTSSGGGGGGGGGSLAVATSSQETAENEAEDTESEDVPTASCDTYLTAFIRFGGKNDESQVKRLQKVLNDFEGAELEENGIYDAKTLAAVHAFQTKYASDILTPWGSSRSTGFVFLTTRKKVNELYCASLKTFPLSSEEMETIEKTKARLSAAPESPAAASAPASESPPQNSTEENGEDSAEENETEAAAQVGAAAESTLETPLNRVWRPFANFFGRFFGRGE